jgi:hypothetical protein
MDAAADGRLMPSRLLPVVVALILAWSVVAAVTGLASTRSQPRRPHASLIAELSALEADLPETGTIGYFDSGGQEPLEIGAGDTTPPTPLHVAQYVFAPRRVRGGLGPDRVVVRRGAPGDNPAVPGYEPIGRWSGEHRVYRPAP